MNFVPLISIMALFAVWFFLLRTKATRLDTREQFDEIISRGQPVVVDFFANT